MKANRDGLEICMNAKYMTIVLAVFVFMGLLLIIRRLYLIVSGQKKTGNKMQVRFLLITVVPVAFICIVFVAQVIWSDIIPFWGGMAVLVIVIIVQRAYMKHLRCPSCGALSCRTNTFLGKMNKVPGMECSECGCKFE